MPSMGLLGAISGASQGLGKYLNDELAAQRQMALEEKRSNLRREDSRVDAEMRDRMARERQEMANTQAISLEDMAQKNRISLEDTRQKNALEAAGTFEPVENVPGAFINRRTGQIARLNDKDRYIKLAGSTNEFGVQGEEKLFDTATGGLVTFGEAQQEGGGIVEAEGGPTETGGGATTFSSREEAMKVLSSQYRDVNEETLDAAIKAGAITIQDTSLESDTAPAPSDDFSLSEMGASEAPPADEAPVSGNSSVTEEVESDSGGKKYQLGMDEIVGVPARETAGFVGDVAGAAADAVSSFNSKANFKIWLDEMTRVKRVPIANLPPEKLKEGLKLYDKGDAIYKRVAEALKKQQEQQVARR